MIEVESRNESPKPETECGRSLPIDVKINDNRFVHPHTLSSNTVVGAHGMCV